jgi:uncharacterized membrane protein YkvA (DUF1232 family)
MFMLLYYKQAKMLKNMMITISLLVLIYLIMGKDVSGLLDRLKNVDWRSKINTLMDKLRPWALKAGRAATRPLLQFYYVMDDDNTSTLDRALIYAAIIYTILPMDFLPRTVYRLLGVLDDGVAMLYVYKIIKNRITPEINSKVEDTLNEWFGVEYEMI